MKARVDAPRGAGCQWQWFLEQREIGRGLRFRKTLQTPESLLKGFINDQLSFIRNVKGSLNCRIEVSIESKYPLAASPRSKNIDKITMKCILYLITLFRGKREITQELETTVRLWLSLKIAPIRPSYTEDILGYRAAMSKNSCLYIHFIVRPFFMLAASARALAVRTRDRGVTPANLKCQQHHDISLAIARLPLRPIPHKNPYKVANLTLTYNQSPQPFGGLPHACLPRRNFVFWCLDIAPTTHP